MKTSDIRRVIDASLDGLKLSPEERQALAERAMSEESAAPPARRAAPGSPGDFCWRRRSRY